jgi:hypothetical protein
MVEGVAYPQMYNLAEVRTKYDLCLLVTPQILRLLGLSRATLQVMLEV